MTNHYTPDMIWQSLGMSPSDLAATPILESSVYLTRGCNLKCQYCKIIKTKLPEEISIERWMDAMDILEAIGVRFVNIAGGEPTILKGLGSLISHLNENKQLRYSLVSNSMFGEQKFRELIDAGIQAYVASVDVLGKDEQSLHDLRKASAGMRMLERLKDAGVPYLCANIVISARNIESVIDVVQYLIDREIWVNVCPIIWGRGDKWDEVDEADEKYRLLPEHHPALRRISAQLMDIKRAGGSILPTESYISGLADHSIELDWHCCGAGGSKPPRLTVDADGGLMTCINMRGTTAERFSIFDMADRENLERFVLAWRQDARQCRGCYWSTMVMARERQQMLEQFQMEAVQCN